MNNNGCNTKIPLGKKIDNPEIRKEFQLYLNIYLGLCAIVCVWVDAQKISAPKKILYKSKLEHTLRNILYNAIELKTGIRPCKLFADGKGVDDAMLRLGDNEVN